MRMRVDVCPASLSSSSPVQVFALVPACHAVVLAQSRSTLHEPGLQRLFSAHINTLLSTFLCPYSKRHRIALMNTFCSRLLGEDYAEPLPSF